MKIVFDEAEHAYTLNGARVPGVTSVFTGLGLVDARWFTEDSRMRGRHVHKAVHLWLSDSLDWGSVHEPWQGYVRAAIRFLEDANAETFGTEEIVGSETFQYCGTRDWRGIAFGDLAIVDWKSGLIGPTTGMQVAAYDTTLDGTPPLYSIRRMGVALHDDGTYKKAEFTDRNDYRRFYSALDLFRTFVFQKEVKRAA